MADIKRYNQGFFKFGPMEQCADGEWIKAEDILPVLEWREEQVYKLQSLCSRRAELMAEVIRQRDECIQERDRVKRELKYARRTATANAVIALAIATLTIIWPHL